MEGRHCRPRPPPHSLTPNTSPDPTLEVGRGRGHSLLPRAAKWACMASVCDMAYGPHSRQWGGSAQDIEPAAFGVPHVVVPAPPPPEQAIWDPAHQGRDWLGLEGRPPIVADVPGCPHGLPSPTLA